MIASGLAIVSLILLLAAPFGVLTPTDGDSYNVMFDEADSFRVSDSGSLNIMATGVVLATVGALVLFALSRTRLATEPKRVVGWVAAMILTTGAFVAVISSSLWIGGGMADGYVAGDQSGVDAPVSGYYQGGVSGILENMIHEPSKTGDFWMISPAIVLITGAALLYIGLTLNTRFAGNSDRVDQFNSYALMGTGVIVAAFLLPWSTLADGDSYLLSAQTILDQAGNTVGRETTWATMAYAFNTFILGGFVLLASAFATGARGLSKVESKGNWLVYPAGFMSIWMVCAWGATWIKGWVPYTEGSSGEAMSEMYSPAYTQFGVLIPLFGLLAFLYMQMAATNSTRTTTAEFE